MIADDRIYGVLDRRYDGTERIIETFREPRHALAAAELLGWLGDRDVRVELVRDVEDDL